MNKIITEKSGILSLYLLTVTLNNKSPDYQDFYSNIFLKYCYSKISNFNTSLCVIDSILSK